MSQHPEVTAFFHADTNTVTYVVRDPASLHCAIIDPVLDFDIKSGRTHTAHADKVLGFIRDNNLHTVWILETHAHADHLTAAPYLADITHAKVAIGAHIVDVQKIFKPIFNLPRDFPTDGSQFDHLFNDGDTLQIGSLTGRVIHTPGHTPACITYVIGDAAFVGDTLFMPDAGTSRCDFPGGSARTLYQSIKKVLELPDTTRLFMCHDYGSADRQTFEWETSVAKERAGNIHVGAGMDEETFVRIRTERDRTLEMPRLLLPSIQVNIQAGHLPEPEDNGVSYLKLPLNRL